jgi:type IV pilus assembly protein PilV
MILRQFNKMSIKKIDRDNGFTILEVLISICILAFGLLAVASMQIASIQGNASANDISEATAWATDRMEKINRVALINYEDGDNLEDENGDGDAGLTNTGAAADYSMNQGDYAVSWNVSEDSLLANTKTVNVLVTWEKRGVSKNISIRNIIPKT